MNYKKSILYSALSLGVVLGANAQSPDFSLNGLGRSIITNNTLSGNFSDNNPSEQTRDISGYNLFDLKTNLDLDSNFHASAIFRTRSPFGTSFGSLTTFEFRQFNMGGNLGGFKYELGDIRVELSPYTVHNSDIAGTGFESDIFQERKDILEYENFNLGNSWLLQGAAGQYGWSFGKESGLGIYAFTTRTVSTNELTVNDRMLSGGRVEYGYDKNLKLGLNSVSLYDLVINTSDFDYQNNVITGDLNYQRQLEGGAVTFDAEFGGSFYNFSDNINEVDTSYSGLVTDVRLGYNLDNAGLKFGLSFQSVDAAFSSPTAQSRRFNPNVNPSLLGSRGGQLYFDQFTDETVYNNQISATLMPYFQIYNNLNPYGDATPNRMIIGFDVATDTSHKAFDAGLNFDYGTELIGEGGDAKRTFIVLTGGTVVHLSNLLQTDRLIDVNAGVRYENTSRTEGAKVDLTSMLVDFGFSAEVVKKLDLLGGLKYFSAVGNEFYANRDGFNLVQGFTEQDFDVNEFILSGGARIRFSKQQFFSLNYNYSMFSNNNLSVASYNLGQVFFNYTGRF